MKSHFYAVIIGFDHFTDKNHLPDLEFAEQDARELYEVLIDPQYGNYPKENCKLITGISTVAEVEEALETYIVKNRTTDDTVLVYYSGHGFFVGDDQEAYLATPDATIEAIRKRSGNGLRMKYIHDEIFDKSKAKNVIFFLDCCHSGAFCTNINLKGDKSLIYDKAFLKDGKVALVSSPAKDVSREDKKLGHGVFTYYLLEGLRYGAVEKDSGAVTYGTLVAYIQEKCLANYKQKTLFYGAGSRIELISPKNKRWQGEESTIEEEVHLRAKEFTGEFQPLCNPIEKQLEYIDHILTHLQSIQTDQNTGEQILNAIKKSLDAKSVFVEQVDHEAKEHRRIFQSTPDLESKADSQYNDTVCSDLLPYLMKEKATLLPTRFGFYRPTPGRKGQMGYSIAIPTRLEKPREFLIISEVNELQLQFGEILGHTLSSLYTITEGLKKFDLSHIEAGLLDYTKRYFGQVPYKSYVRRFDKFKEHLNRVHFYFEPLVSLRSKYPEIHSWEALARNPATQRAPVDLFKAAELWGPEFITELDLYCLRKAITEYNLIWKEERGNEKMDQLSVNVYPETLFRRAYKEQLTEIIRSEDLIQGEKLVLELSEKRPVPQTDRLGDMPTYTDPVDQLNQVLKAFSRDLYIKFTIDDFGVGYSSASRLAKMELDHVKIDRDILHHPYPQITIQYVKQLLQETHQNHPITVVIEGYDDDSNISLADIFHKLNIHLIQGHFIRPAQQSVRRLDEATEKKLISSLQQKGVNGSKAVMGINTALNDAQQTVE